MTEEAAEGDLKHLLALASRLLALCIGAGLLVWAFAADRGWVTAGGLIFAVGYALGWFSRGSKPKPPAN